MRVKDKFFLIYTLYVIAVSFYMIELLVGYERFGRSFIFLVGFVLSFYWMGYFIIKDLTSSNVISLRLLFNVFGFLYSNNYIINLVSNGLPVDDYTGAAMYISHLAVFSFNLFYSSTKTNNHKLNSYKRELDVDKFSLGLLLLFIICFAAEYYLVVKVIGLQEYILASRADRTLMRAGYSLLTFYKHTIPMVSAVSLYIFMEYKKKLSFLVFVLSLLLAIAHSLISVSRTEFLATILPVVFLLNRYKVLSNKMLLLIGAGGFVLMGIWKSLLQSESGTLVMQQDSEFNTWYGICHNIMKKDGGVELIWGRSYLVTLLNLIFPVTGIETLSTWYLRIYEPDVLAMGGGRGFPATFEAYMNLGIIGVVGVYGFYGYLAKKININTELGLFVFLIIIVSIHQLYRSEAYSFWKNMMWFRMYPMLILYFLSSKRRKTVNLQ